MRSLSTTGLPAELLQLTAHLALEAQPVAEPDDRPWSVPLLVTPEAEAWLLGWPAGLVTTAHGHGDATVAVSVVEGALSEECLDPTIWTTGRRTTWRAGATTVFSPGHVHLLGAAGRSPAGRGRPRLERARRVRPTCRRPACARPSWRSGWPGPWWWR